MKRLRLIQRDRRRRQQGSILSGLLIIVAFLSILIGALLTELTDSFIVSRELADRFRSEATGTSAVELAIHNLQGGPVPAVCARDSRGPWFLTLNGRPAAVTQTCTAITAEVQTGLASGSSAVDGVHATTGGRDRYLVADSTGVLSGYTFGQTARSWAVSIGGVPTGTLLPKAGSGSSSVLLIPAMGGVALFNDGGGAPTHTCNMPASTDVTTTPAIETTASGSLNFPTYTFFGGSGVAGWLYVYDASASGSCVLKKSAGLGAGMAGAPLVFPGRISINNGFLTINDEMFVLVSDGSDTSVEHWRYAETQSCSGGCDDADDGTGPVTSSLSQVGSLSLTNYVGGTAAGYDTNVAAPSSGSNLTLAVAGTSGKMATVVISWSSGPAYTIVGVANTNPLPGGISRPPYWCHCPSGDVIGVGGTNGVLYLLNSSLTIQWTYDGLPDGRPAINTTPAADSNGDWYFGADDGYVYDVEIPNGIPQMFKAARFGPGPGGAIASSPIVGACTNGPCLYFASSSAGSYFVRIGSTRVSDLRACVTSSPGSTTCAANPRLWAKVQVGPSAVWGGNGVFVQGWSFYSP